MKTRHGVYGMIKTVKINMSHTHMKTRHGVYGMLNTVKINLDHTHENSSWSLWHDRYR